MCQTPLWNPYKTTSGKKSRGKNFLSVYLGREPQKGPRKHIFFYFFRLFCVFLHGKNFENIDKISINNDSRKKGKSYSRLGFQVVSAMGPFGCQDQPSKGCFAKFISTVSSEVS